jgi:Putative prokaryotic signal transducing protein
LNELTPQPGNRDRSREPLVRIAVAENPATAELVKQELAEAGIQCMAKNTDALGVMSGSLWSSPFSVELFVLSGDEAAAQRVLAEKGFNTDGPIALPEKRRYKRRPK